MPVDTRRISYAADTQAAGIQPSSMVARGQGPDPNENQPKNEQQEDKTPPKPMPGPRTPTPSAHAVAAELADPPARGRRQADCTWQAAQHGQVTPPFRTRQAAFERVASM